MSTPMKPWLKLTKQEGQPMEDATFCQQPNGGLFYLTIIRPDIAYSIRVISQLMDKPSEYHFTTAKRVLRYVKGTLSFGLMYKQHTPFVFSGFVDVDWGWRYE